MGHESGFCPPGEFYERFRNDPDAAKRKAFQAGQDIGRGFLRKLDIKGGDLGDVATVLNEFQKTVQGEPSAKVEGNKVTMRCLGLCPVMRAALTLNIPWIWLDTNYGLPVVEGVASAVIPGIKMRMASMKSRGDSACVYIFEL